MEYFGLYHKRKKNNAIRRESLEGKTKKAEEIIHYKNGREAQVGDPVIGTTYNRKGTQVGVLVGITAGTDTCNCRVAVIDLAATPEAFGVGRMPVPTLDSNFVSPMIDYSACADLIHADDAWAVIAANGIPDSTKTT